MNNFSYQNKINDGFYKEKTFDATKRLTVEVSTPYESDKSDEFYSRTAGVPNNIKREISHKLLTELVDYIEYGEHISHYKFHKVYHGSITITPKNIKMAECFNEKFRVNGVDFTEDEIIHAIKKTYSERLI